MDYSDKNHIPKTNTIQEVTLVQGVSADMEAVILVDTVVKASMVYLEAENKVVD